MDYKSLDIIDANSTKDRRKPIELELVTTLSKNKHELLCPTKDVEIFDTKRLENLFEAMKDIMKSANGVGLAANQIGINESIFIADIPFMDEEKAYTGINIFINPVIITKSFKRTVKRESCLSVPGLYPKVERSKYIEVEFRGINGEIFYHKFANDEAIIIQHEIDHLRGVTINEIGWFV